MTKTIQMYTPGPWQVRGADENDDGTPGANYDRDIEPATNDTPGGWPYFILRDRTSLGCGPIHVASSIQDLADARLIAAAPDMLQALRTAEGELIAALGSASMALDAARKYPAVLKIRAAIAKAQG